MTKIFYLFDFAFFYLREVIKSNFAVALDVVSPRLRMRPAKVPLNVADLTERQLVVYANLISMTPGTLSLDVSPDQKTLLIHAMYVDSPEALAQEMETTFKKRIINVF